MHSALLLRVLPLSVGLLVLVGCRDQSSLSEPEPAELSAPRREPAGDALVASNTWATRKPMPTPRAYLVAGVVNNILYAVGGVKDSQIWAIAKVEAYNAVSNTWSTKPPLPGARREANGATAINGILYIPGGISNAGAVTRSLFAYNPATNTWSRKANMPVASFAGTSVVIQGKLYMTSGSTERGFSNLLHRYDPSTDTWTELAPSPRAHFHATGSIVGGKLLLVGGYDYDDPAIGSHLTDALDVYDPATNTWTTKAPMPSPRFGATARTINQMLYVVGGVDEAIVDDPITGALEVYDQSTNAWTTRRPMPTARAYPAAGVIGGRLYVVGGVDTSDPRQMLGTLEAYTP
jgi:N-acetylneuraminic acid mutarotase